ncbi:hypothetical protein [Cellulomonas sp. NS3]|uniref:hypothetical protein n=1 Tax=Cellulomonas sp. NS3 TaxID=2973977 RepID=UPI002161B307|nr:hypothetical protein [Cellulomonas sp. NS3]
MNEVTAASYVRVDGEFRPIRDAERHDDSCRWVPGAISLTVDGVELMGVTLWDDVNWLWPFVVQALDECRRSGSGQRAFPSQGIYFGASALRGGADLLLRVTTPDGSIDRRAVAPADKLYVTVARAGIEFFEELRRLCGSEADPSVQEEAPLRRWLDEMGLSPHPDGG